jgi:hypothetical protein
MLSTEAAEKQRLRIPDPSRDIPGRKRSVSRELQSVLVSALNVNLRDMIGEAYNGEHQERIAGAHDRVQRRARAGAARRGEGH